MNAKKYKYYFAKPRSEITKDVLRCLLVGGAIVIVAGSPSFALNLWRRILGSLQGKKKYSRKKLYDAFYNLRRQGCIAIKKYNHQIYISLTEEGKKKAGWLQIDALRIKKPKRWDGYWRLVIFDISERRRIYREALRGKLKELGFHKFQNSVWIYPFDCKAEIELLKDFFGFRKGELKLVTAKSIDNDEELKKFFHLI